jgi:hypothetical protein
MRSETLRPETLAKMKRLQAEARQRIVERGKVEFRAEPDLMDQLCDRARELRVPFGPMVRDMVKAQLELEAKNEPTQLDKIEKKIDKLLRM